MNTFIKSIISGILIGIGGSVYLISNSAILGATLFSFGLFYVLYYQFRLFTGMIGFALDKDLKTNLNLITIIIGNFIGTFITASLIKLTRTYDVILPKAQALVDIKLGDNALSVLVLAFFCGLLMYLACNLYYQDKQDIVKIGAILLSVIVFTLLGFEHSIANMYYFSVSNSWSLHSFFYIILALSGNAMGSLFIPILKKYIYKN